MEQRENENGRQLHISRFRWVIGAPYFVQGTSTLTEIPILYFTKLTLQMGDAGGQLFDALRQSCWFIKPLWGIISDKVPVFGYHRKSWYILMAFAATVFWLLNALLSFVGIKIPLVYLVTFNLAYAGVSCAFLMSLSNATNMFEGVVGAGLYNIFTHPLLNRLVAAFEDSFLNIAQTGDDRTLILQIFVYISLLFTLLTIPFIELLRRELEQRKVEINLGKRP